MSAKSLQPGAVQKVVLGGMHFPIQIYCNCNWGPSALAQLGLIPTVFFTTESFSSSVTLFRDVKHSLLVLSPAATHSFQRGLHCPPSGSWMLLWGLKGRARRAAGMPLLPKTSQDSITLLLCAPGDWLQLLHLSFSHSLYHKRVTYLNITSIP